MAEPAIAASTWSHNPCSRAMAAVVATGSRAVVAVVVCGDDGAGFASRDVGFDQATQLIRPHSEGIVVGDMAEVVTADPPAAPCRLSCVPGQTMGRQRMLFGLPAATARTVLRHPFARASIATRVLVDAVSWITPLQASDRPAIRRNQSVTTSSSSVSAGQDCQVRPSVPRPVAR